MMGGFRNSRPLCLVILILYVSCCCNVSEARHHRPKPSAVVVGAVYCDSCFQDDHSKASHYISGATVAVECAEGRNKPAFDQEVKTDNQGNFKVALPFSVSKHVKKIEGCNVKLVKSSEPNCAVASTATSSLIHLKERKGGNHIFSAGYFTFKPLKQPGLCNQQPSVTKSLMNYVGDLLNPQLPEPQIPTIPTIPTLPNPNIPLPNVPSLLPPLPSLPLLPPLGSSLETLPPTTLPPTPLPPTTLPPTPLPDPTPLPPTTLPPTALPPTTLPPTTLPPTTLPPTPLPPTPLPPTPLPPTTLPPTPLPPTPLPPTTLPPTPLPPTPLPPTPLPPSPVPAIPGITPVPTPSPPATSLPPGIPLVPGLPPVKPMKAMNP